MLSKNPQAPNRITWVLSWKPSNLSAADFSAITSSPESRVSGDWKTADLPSAGSIECLYCSYVRIYTHTKSVYTYIYIHTASKCVTVYIQLYTYMDLLVDLSTYCLRNHRHAPLLILLMPVPGPAPKDCALPTCTATRRPMQNHDVFEYSKMLKC